MGQCRVTASTCMIVTKYDNAELKTVLDVEAGSLVYSILHSKVA